MKNRADIAVEKFAQGYNCAQSVVYSFCDDLRLDKNSALKMACGFGAGMGRKQEVCGAVTGGILVIGAKYGRGENDDPSATEQTYAKARELMDRFSGRRGTFLCRKLLDGCDLSTEEGHRRFAEKDLRNGTCRLCVQDAVDILEGIIGP